MLVAGLALAGGGLRDAEAGRKEIQGPEVEAVLPATFRASPKTWNSRHLFFFGNREDEDYAAYGDEEQEPEAVEESSGLNLDEEQEPEPSEESSGSFIGDLLNVVTDLAFGAEEATRPAAEAEAPAEAPAEESSGLNLDEEQEAEAMEESSGAFVGDLNVVTDLVFGPEEEAAKPATEAEAPAKAAAVDEAARIDAEEEEAAEAARIAAAEEEAAEAARIAVEEQEIQSVETVCANRGWSLKYACRQRVGKVLGLERVSDGESGYDLVYTWDDSVSRRDKAEAAVAAGECPRCDDVATYHPAGGGYVCADQSPDSDDFGAVLGGIFTGKILGMPAPWPGSGCDILCGALCDGTCCYV